MGIYIGTSILNAEEICRNTEYSIRLGIELSQKYAFKLRYLNVGGGFGIPYFQREKALDLSALEMEFGIEFAEDDLLVDSLCTVQKLILVVRKYLV